MEITEGMVIVGISIMGAIGCIVALAVSRVLFLKQRKNLLKKIETE